MEFQKFNQLLRQHVKKMCEGASRLYVVDSDREALWQLYLDSFPEGENELFRSRREFDCRCCKQFIKTFGSVISIEDYQPLSIWDFNVGATKYQPVIENLANYVKSLPIADVFISDSITIGKEKTYEPPDRPWYHFQVELSDRFVLVNTGQFPTLKSRYRSQKEAFARSLVDITPNAIDLVLDCLEQNTLYRGEEWKYPLQTFAKLQQEFLNLPRDNRQSHYFIWDKAGQVGIGITNLINHSIGVLLKDLSNGIDLDTALRKYEKIVAPSNYKRPKAEFSPRQLAEAEKTVIDLDLLDSLPRRFAKIEDITINDILFVDRDARKNLKESVFDTMREEKITNMVIKHKEQIAIADFVEEILPNIKHLSLLVEPRHETNLFSLIAPQNPNTPSLFKWNNGFSWSYKGNIADSMRQRVKAAGGKIDGVLRFSLQWNDDGDNNNDFDAYCIEPDGNHIYFRNKGRNHSSSGMLDVDIMEPAGKIAVENIIYSSLAKMPIGEYLFGVNNYCHRGGRSGFSAEIEFEGNILEFNYDRELRHQEKVIVAKIDLDGEKFQIKESLPSQPLNKNIWGITTNKFSPVSIAMFSPNYWVSEIGAGNKHYLFALKDCINPERPNGFFNEYLKQELQEHKRVFEALGAKMQVVDSQDQISGLGFSSTQRNAIVAKADDRLMEILF